MENIEREEMFRITSMRMAQWRLAAQTGKSLATGATPQADMGSKNKKGPKKDKPNPCQPSKKKEEAKKPAFEFVNTTPEGEKKDCSTEMPAAYEPK